MTAAAPEGRRLLLPIRLPTAGEGDCINEQVCRGCGDCGRVPRVTVVLAVDSTFGRKIGSTGRPASPTGAVRAGCPSPLSEPKTARRRRLGGEDKRGRYPLPPGWAARGGGRGEHRMPGISGTGVAVSRSPSGPPISTAGAADWSRREGWPRKGGPRRQRTDLRRSGASCRISACGRLLGTVCSGARA